jgi:hypothetical protein
MREVLYGLVSRKMAKNMIWAKNKFRMSRAEAVQRKICATPTA